MNMKQLRKHYKSDEEIAKLFGISRQAVHKWGDGELPYARLLELQYVKRPDLFRKRA